MGVGGSGGGGEGVNIISFTCGHIFPTTTSRQVHVPANDTHTHALLSTTVASVNLFRESLSGRRRRHRRRRLHGMEVGRRIRVGGVERQGLSIALCCPISV